MFFQCVPLNSVYFCSKRHPFQNPSKHGFLIADAGGGTLDISAYAIRGTSPLVMEEVAPPDCEFHAKTSEIFGFKVCIQVFLQDRSS